MRVGGRYADGRRGRSRSGDRGRAGRSGGLSLPRGAWSPVATSPRLVPPAWRAGGLGGAPLVRGLPPDGGGGLADRGEWRQPDVGLERRRLRAPDEARQASRTRPGSRAHPGRAWRPWASECASDCPSRPTTPAGLTLPLGAWRRRAAAIVVRRLERLPQLTPAREYELVLMLDPEIPEERREQIASEARKRIESGGSLKHDTSWGMRKLAYEIQQRTEADYRFFRFETEGGLLDDLNHNLRIADGVLRFRVFKVDPRLAGDRSAGAPGDLRRASGSGRAPSAGRPRTASRRPPPRPRNRLRTRGRARPPRPRRDERLRPRQPAKTPRARPPRRRRGRKPRRPPSRTPSRPSSLGRPAFRWAAPRTRKLGLPCRRGARTRRGRP